jgi:hypothetical protein
VVDCVCVCVCACVRACVRDIDPEMVLDDGVRLSQW